MGCMVNPWPAVARRTLSSRVCMWRHYLDLGLVVVEVSYVGAQPSRVARAILARKPSFGDENSQPSVEKGAALSVRQRPDSFL